MDRRERVNAPSRVKGCRDERDERKGENEAAQAARGGATLRGFR